MAWNSDKALAEVLLPGEIVRWTDAPSFWPMLGSQVFNLVLATVFLMLPGSAILNGLQEWLNGHRPNIGVIGFIFTAIFPVFGLYIIGSAALKVFGFGRTTYAVTSRRILIVEGFGTPQVTAVTPGDVNILDWKEKGDGSGTVTFKRETRQDSEGTTTINTRFIGTKDVRNAVQAIELLRASSERQI